MHLPARELHGLPDVAGGQRREVPVLSQPQLHLAGPGLDRDHPLGIRALRHPVRRSLLDIPWPRNRSPTL